MRIIYNTDIVDNATPSSITENPNYPVSNIQDSRLSRVYRSTDTEQEFIFINAGGSASYCFMYSENIPEDATVTLFGNDDNDFDSNAFEQAMVKRGNWWVADFSEQEYDFWAIYIDFSDTGDPEFIEVGRVIISTYVQLPDLPYGYQWDEQTNSRSSESISGQTYGDIRKEWKTFKEDFPRVSESQMANLKTIWAYVRNVKPFILLLWSARLDLEPPYYMKFNMEVLPSKRVNNRNIPWSTSLNCREVF